MAKQSSIPAQIAQLNPIASNGIQELVRQAEFELVRFDSEHGEKIQDFAPILLRSEAAASSQIENLSASARQIFTAEIGGKTAPNAALIAANTHTMVAAIELADKPSSATIKKMHEVLMQHAPRHTPGLFRTEPVWIGASGDSPVNAQFVGPPHDQIELHVADLIQFLQQHETQPLVQIAVAHAQFETIHPFTDGNGRTGRALVQALLRHRGLTRNVAVPVSAGLLANVQGYYDALTSYRGGNIDDIIEQFSVASLRAVENARILVHEIAEIGQKWEEVAKPRRGSAKVRLLKYALYRPVFTADMAADALGVSVTNVYRDLKQLEELQILAVKAEYQGSAIWRAPEVLSVIDNFASRAGRRSFR